MSINILRFFEHLLHNGTNENELVAFAVEKKLFSKLSELKARNLQSKLLCRYLGAIDFRGRRRYCGPQRVGVDAALLRSYWTTWNEPSTAFWRNIASMFLPANRVLADYAVLEQDTAFFSTTQASAQKANSYLYTAGHLTFMQPGHNPAFIWAFLYQVCVSRSVTVSLGTLTRCDVGTDLCFQAIGVSSAQRLTLSTKRKDDFFTFSACHRIALVKCFRCGLNTEGNKTTLPRSRTAYFNLWTVKITKSICSFQRTHARPVYSIGFIVVSSSATSPKHSTAMLQSSRHSFDTFSSKDKGLHFSWTRVLMFPGPGSTFFLDPSPHFPGPLSTFS